MGIALYASCVISAPCSRICGCAHITTKACVRRPAAIVHTAIIITGARVDVAPVYLADVAPTNISVEAAIVTSSKARGLAGVVVARIVQRTVIKSAGVIRTTVRRARVSVVACVRATTVVRPVRTWIIIGTRV